MLTPMSWHAWCNSRSNVFKSLPYPQRWAAVPIPCLAFALAQSIRSVPFKGVDEAMNLTLLNFALLANLPKLFLPLISRRTEYRVRVAKTQISDVLCANTYKLHKLKSPLLSRSPIHLLQTEDDVTGSWVGRDSRHPGGTCY